MYQFIRTGDMYNKMLAIELLSMFSVLLSVHLPDRLWRVI